jgi:hypothetical protein
MFPAVKESFDRHYSSMHYSSMCYTLGERPAPQGKQYKNYLSVFCPAGKNYLSVYLLC